MKITRSFALALLLSACLTTGSSSTVRAERQLAAAAQSTADVRRIAETEAPELVGALMALESAFDEARLVLEREGKLETLDSALAVLESTILLAADEPRIALALVAVKAALMQVQAAQP